MLSLAYFLYHHDNLFDVAAMVDRDESKDEDKEIHRALAASMEGKNGSSGASGSDKDAVLLSGSKKQPCLSGLHI